MKPILLWKGKGTQVQISPDGKYVMFNHGGIRIVDVATKVEIFFHPTGQDPQWLDEMYVAFRMPGDSEFWICSLDSHKMHHGGFAPGAVFYAWGEEFLSWEKKSGTLWMNGVAIAWDSPRPSPLRPLVFIPDENPIPDGWEQIPSVGEIVVNEKVVGWMIGAEYPERKLKVWILPDAREEDQDGTTE
jgi:hypothetical protein